MALGSEGPHGDAGGRPRLADASRGDLIQDKPRPRVRALWSARGDRGAGAIAWRPADVALTGADLYRLNCQACHGLEGKGAPPEIKSAVDPVRGVPLDVLRAQMKAQHQPPGEAEARARPEHVRAEILQRVHTGGQRMPSREHLSAGELDLLFAYLGVLAGSPQAGPAKHETVSWARVGQHVVKGTCHICHDAVGPRPSAEQIGQGKIPSLQSLLSTQSGGGVRHQGP